MCAPLTHALALNSQTTRSSRPIRFLVFSTDHTTDHYSPPTNHRVFIYFRTPYAQWSFATLLPSITSALFPIQWRGESSFLPPILRHSFTLSPEGPRVTSHDSPIAKLQIYPSIFNHLQIVAPATPLFSIFCIAARRCVSPIGVPE
jgi:hypothetical protein